MSASDHFTDIGKHLNEEYKSYHRPEESRHMSNLDDNYSSNNEDRLNKLIKGMDNLHFTFTINL